MGSCNIIQNEIGGKELLLKACRDRLATTIAGVKAALTVQGITVTAQLFGTGGNSITLELSDPGANNAVLSVVVTLNAIKVNLATDGAGLITSTAVDVIAALTASAPALALVAASGAGAIALTDTAPTALTGGINGDSITVSVAVAPKIGDIVRFNEVGSLTSVILGQFYAVVEVPSPTVFKIASTLGGTAIHMNAAEVGLEVDVFCTFGGLRSKSFGFSSESVDITNGDSDEWKKILDGAGLRSFNVSGSGVYTNEEVFQAVFLAARSNLLTCLMFIEVKTGTIFSGCFKIPSMEISGDYNAESAYSMSAESSGEIEVVVMS